MKPTALRRAVVLLVLSALLIAVTLPVTAETKYEADWASLDKRPCPSWYLDAKFGIFIHWGVYAVPSWAPVGKYAEWYWHDLGNKAPDQRNEKDEKNPYWKHHVATWGKDFTYDQFVPKFTAEKFDPDAWAQLFVDAGAKYVAPTSKHHDGFALWPSAEATKTWGRPWNAVDAGPKRDLLGGLGDACRKKGLKYGFYYSFYEWFNPLWQKDKKAFVETHMIPQFKDVLTKYKPAILFLDGEWDLKDKDWHSEELAAWIYNESPSREEIVVNDRWGKACRHKHGDYYTTEYGAGLPNADHPWEENRGMGHSYGFNQNEKETDYKTGRELIIMFADLVSRGGNLLLNIGPKADGTIPEVMRDRLLQMGAWLKVNGEAIYGSRTFSRVCQWSDGQKPEQKFGEFMVKYDLMTMIGPEPKDGKAVKQCFFTTKPGALYAIFPYWPGKQVTLKELTAGAGTKVTLLGHAGELKFKAEGGTIVVDLPEIDPATFPGKHAYTLKLTDVK
jgi:alpha-L-fucosidase